MGRDPEIRDIHPHSAGPGGAAGVPGACGEQEVCLSLQWDRVQDAQLLQLRCWC